jgi:hypothetical protein
MPVKRKRLLSRANSNQPPCCLDETDGIDSLRDPMPEVEFTKALNRLAMVKSAAKE